MHSIDYRLHSYICKIYILFIWAVLFNSFDCFYSIYVSLSKIVLTF